MTNTKAISASAIKKLRKKLGLTQAEFAFRLGLTRAAIFQWEKGETRPTGSSRILMHLMRKKLSADRG